LFTRTGGVLVWLVAVALELLSLAVMLIRVSRRTGAAEEGVI
jgi:hypothetical protein